MSKMKLHMSTINFIKLAKATLLGGLSLLSTVVLLKATHYELNVMSGLEIVFILGLNYYVYQKILKERPKRTDLWVVASIFGVIVAAVLVLGGNVNQFGSAFIGSWKTWVKIVLLIPSFTSLAMWLYIDVIPNVNSKLDVIKVKPIRSRYVFLGAWAMILIMWLPTLLATMPGNYGYDSGYQIMDYYSRHDYGLHQPLAHSWLLVFFVLKLGKGILHSPWIGLLLYTLLQMIVLAGSLALITLVMKQRKVNTILIWLTLLIFGISPYFSVTAISTTKNAWFSAFFVILVVVIIQKRWIIKSLKLNEFIYWFLLVVVGFMCIIFINQGIYVLIFGLMIGIITQSKDRWKILGCMVGIVFLYSLYTGPLYRALDLKMTDSLYAEPLSVPIMQLANTYENHGNLTRYERKEIREYIGIPDTYNQTQALSDPIKSPFNGTKFKNNKSRFLKLYMEVGKKNISKYIDAFTSLSLGEWYPSFNLPLDRTLYNNQYIEYRGNNDYSQNFSWYQINVAPIKKAVQLRNYYNHLFIYYPDSQFALLRIPNTPGFAMIIWLLFAGWCILKKKAEYWMALGMIFGLWGTLLLGPIAIYRYAFPIIIMVPIMFAVMIGAQQDTGLYHREIAITKRRRNGKDS